jgi:hypothetical protein
MEYKIVRGDTPAELIAAVNAAIAKGWEPQGGMAHVPTWGLCQAMIRRRISTHFGNP